MYNDNYLDKLLDEVQKGELLIMGDFNFHIDWDQWYSASSDISRNNFLCCVADHFLYQLVNFPTRYREHTKPSMLDLILTDDENHI